MFDIRAIQEQVLYENVRAASNEQTASKVVYGAPTDTAVSDAEWVASSMQKLEHAFDKPAVEQIRMRCQCGYGMEERLTLIKELIAASSSLEEFETRKSARGGNVLSRRRAVSAVLLLPLPHARHCRRLESDTWCQCTRGYTKVLFGGRSAARSKWSCSRASKRAATYASSELHRKALSGGDTQG
jgi:hypothetical protein